MAFHQLEKVLARAATDRSFRDELAAGDADLDDLGLSDDEQSVLSELMASSGAGLDAVLNVVTALPSGAAVHSGLSSGIPVLPGMSALPEAGQPLADPADPTGAAGPAVFGFPAGETPGGHGVPNPATTTPAFALMTPSGASATMPAMATAAAGANAMPAAMPAAYPSGIAGIPAGYPGSAAGLPAGYPAQPGVVGSGYPAPASGVPAGYPPVGYPSSQQVPAARSAHPGQSFPSFPPVDLPAGPMDSADPAEPAAGSPYPEHRGAQRNLDAGDVGRPVVARLPFGMDVVK